MWSDQHIWIGCSGAFTMERVLHGMVAGLHSNDVQGYSSAIGMYLADRDVPFTLKEEHRDELDWLAPYLETAAGTLAAIMLGTRFLQWVGKEGVYYDRMLRAHQDQFDEVHAKTVEKIESADMRIDSYHAMDVREWLRDVVPADDAVAMFPPFFCMAPDERILTADLRWVRCGDLQHGDGILAFEEEPQPGNRSRRWQWGTVTRSEPAVAPCVRVTLDDGSSVVTTRNHPWMAHTHRTVGSKGTWVHAEDLIPGKHHVQRLTGTWEADDSRSGGWLAGIFDGEGNIHLNSSTSKLAVSQNPGLISDQFVLDMKEFGFDVGVHPRPIGCVGHEVEGGLPSILRVLGTLRPERLIRDLRLRQDIGQRTTRSRVSEDYRRCAVVAVEDIGVQSIQQIETSTKTYVGEGFAMHNSGDYESQFAMIDTFFDWPEPTYPELDEAGKDELVELVRDRPNWLMGLHIQRDELRPFLRGRVQTSNRGVPIYVYSSGETSRIVRPRQEVERIPMSKIGPADTIDGGGVMRIHPLTGGQFAMIRSQFMAKSIKPGSPLLACGVSVDGKIVGAFAYLPPKFDPDCVYLMSDFPVSWSRYKHLAKLIILAAMSMEAKQLVQRPLAHLVTKVATTAFTNRPVSMKYRSVMKLASRKPAEDGIHEFQLQYEGAMGEWTLQEGLTMWAEKWSAAK